MKIAVVVLADVETHEDLARVVNAMVTAGESKEAGDEIELVFDGASTRWPRELTQPSHRAHGLWEQVQDVVAGACSYCADAFQATGLVEDAGVKLLDEYHRHPSFRTLLANGYQLVTF